MERGAPRSLAERGYLVGLAGVLALEAAAAATQIATGAPAPWATLVATLFVVSCMVRIHGSWGTMAFVALVAAIPFGSEFLGVLTGIPYGPYRYGTAPPPWLFGLVPAFILVAWIYIGYLAIATTTAGLGRSTYWLAPVDGLVATAWDVVIDPVAVRVGYWRWSAGGGLYDVPLTNFAGWFVVVMLLSLAVRWTWAHDVRVPARTSRTMLAILPALLLGSSLHFAALDLADGFVLSPILGLGVLVPAIAAAWDRIGAMSRGAAAPSPWSRPAPTVAKVEAGAERG